MVPDMQQVGKMKDYSLTPSVKSRILRWYLQKASVNQGRSEEPTVTDSAFSSCRRPMLRFGKRLLFCQQHRFNVLKKKEQIHCRQCFVLEGARGSRFTV